MMVDAMHRRVWEQRAERAEAALADAEAEIVELKTKLGEVRSLAELWARLAPADGLITAAQATVCNDNATAILARLNQ